MRCSQLETRLNDVLDRRGDPLCDAEIVAHTAACPRCRRLTAAYVAVAEGAGKMRNPNAHVRRLAVGPRGAAGLIFTVAATLLFFVTQGPPKSMPVAAPASVGVAKRPTPLVTELALTTGRASVGLVHGAARSVDEAFLLASSLPPPGDLLDPVLFPEDGLWRRVGAEWAPVAGETLDALGRALADDQPRQL